MTEESYDDTVLYPVAKLIVKKLDDFYFAFNVDYPNIIVTDKIGKGFLELCDGTRKVSDIFDCLCSQYPGEVSKVEITSFARSLMKNDFVSTEPDCKPTRPRRSFGKLYKLYANITHACNMECKYCYINAREPYKNELTEQEWAYQITEFSGLGGTELVITGGEPFIRKNVLRPVVTTARELGIEKINIETNGTLIDEEDGNFCARNKVRVCVGLGGASSQIHTRVRGGAFEEAIRGIRNLIGAGVDTAIGMTITRTNLHEAEDLLKLAKKLGAGSITLSQVTMVGRAKDYPELEVPLKETVPIFKKVLDEGQRLGVKTAYEAVVMDTKQLPVRNLCEAGTGILSISSNGDVYPCNSFQETPFKAGNVREKNLSQIWKDSEVLKMFRSLDISDIPECRDCEWRHLCSGGCIAQTFHAYGTMKKCSPHCSYFKEVYSALITRLARKLWNEG